MSAVDRLAEIIRSHVPEPDRSDALVLLEGLRPPAERHPDGLVPAPGLAASTWPPPDPTPVPPEEP